MFSLPLTTIMNKKRSLEDTCDIFLSRCRRGIRSSSPITNRRAASESTHGAPTSCANSVTPPFFVLPRPPDLPSLSDISLRVPSTKPLPLPGSSGEPQPKLSRTVNGRQHVPRPRNPFILFRCDLVHQRKVLPRSDLDDTNISRIAGDLWREMTAVQKKPWIELAAREKARHALLYPDYKYAPGSTGTKGKKGKNDHAYLEERPPRQVSKMGTPSVPDPKSSRHSKRPQPYPQPLLRRRSSSCPPVGAVPSQAPSDGWMHALVSQDDMQRRPSRAVMYQSVTQQAAVEPTVPASAAYNHLLPSRGYDLLSSLQPVPLLLDSTYALLDLNQNQRPESYCAPNFGFFHDKFEPTLSSGTCDPGFTAQELADMERLAVGTTFTDPFSASFAIPVDKDSPYTHSTEISPFDCSGYPSRSPSSLSSMGTL